MRQVVKLQPTAAERAALAVTLRRCNELANRVSSTAFRHRDLQTGRIERLASLHRRVYGALKRAGLGAQAAVRVIGKVLGAYATLYGQVETGTLCGR